MFALADAEQALGAPPGPSGVAGQAPGAAGQDTTVSKRQPTDQQVIDQLPDGSPAVTTNAASGEGWSDWAAINLQRLNTQHTRDHHRTLSVANSNTLSRSL